VKTIVQTPRYAASSPRVSVLAVLSGHEADAVDALSLVAASDYEDLELLVMSSAPARAVERFVVDHRDLAAALIRQDTDRGVAQSRNELISRARGEYVFVLNTSGGIYPSSLDRLVRALDADPQALFAYSMIGVFDEGRPVELLGSLPWEPARLARRSWIDAMALLRRERLLELGAYSGDPRVAGWEDWDLWCRCAEAGSHGVHVPQVLGWHRPSATRTPEDRPPQTLAEGRFPRLFAASTWA
jgi:hypothetical protein